MSTQIGDVTGKLTLDTSQFDASNKKAQEEATATERALAEAAKRTSEAQARAARYAGDTITEQGKRIREARDQERQAGKDIADLQKALKRGYLDEAEGSAAVTAAIQRQIAAQKELAALTRTHGHDISDRMAASATIRGLEGTGGIRSIEAFTTTIPGAAAAMQALFPIIGGVGLAGLFFEMGEKGYEAFQKVRKAAELTREAFEANHDKAQVAIDDKAIENQRIQDQIDKLSGHPNNGLAMALLEASKYADQLIGKLQEDRKQLDALLQEHSTGKLGTLLSVIGLGPTTTGQQAKEMDRDAQDLLKQVRKAKTDFNREMSEAPNDTARKAATEKFNNAIKASFQSQIDTYKAEDKRLAELEAPQKIVTKNGVITTREDHSPQRANVQGRVGQLQDLMADEMLDESIYGGRIKLGKLKQDDGGDDTNKKAEAQMKGFEDVLNRRKQVEQVGVEEEINYWQRMLVPAQAYAANVQKINEKLGSLNQRFYHEVGEIIDKAAKDQKERAHRDDEGLLHVITEWERQGEAAAEAQDKLGAAQRRNNNEALDWTRSQEVATGALGRKNAAMQAAAEHATEYAAELAALDDREKRLANRTTISDDERAQQKAQIDEARVNITGQRDRASAADQKSIYDATAIGGVTQALGAFTASALDTSRVLEQLTTQGLDAFNRAALATITGQNGRGKHAFADAGKGLATDVAGASLKGAEGMLLKGLGIGKGKPTGTASDPLHVVMGGIGAGAGALGNLGKDAGGWFGKLASAIHLPGFATGGAVSEGTMAMVGENGPEPVFFGDSARVMSNGDMRNALNGGGGGPTIHVDARGATDPAAVEAAAHRAVKAYIPGIVAASVGAGRNDNARRAPSQRN